MQREQTELFSSEEIGKHFQGRRFNILRQLKECNELHSALVSAVASGRMTGLEMLRWDNTVIEKQTKLTFRLQLLDRDEKLAERQRRTEGSAIV